MKLFPLTKKRQDNVVAEKKSDRLLIASGLAFAVASAQFALTMAQSGGWQTAGGKEYLHIYAMPGTPMANQGKDAKIVDKNGRALDMTPVGSIAAPLQADRFDISDYRILEMAHGRVLISGPTGRRWLDPESKDAVFGRVGTLEKRRGRWVMSTDQGNLASDP